MGTRIWKDGWLGLCMVLVASGLIGCTDSKPEASTPKPATPKAQPKPMVIGANYAIANLAYQLSGNGADLLVIYPVPAGIAPRLWKPAPEELAKMRLQITKASASGTVVFLTSAAETPEWAEKLIQGTPAREIVLPALADASTGYHPQLVQRLNGEISKALIQLSPEKTEVITARAKQLDAELAKLDEDWKHLTDRLQLPPEIAGFGAPLKRWSEDYGLSIRVETDDQVLEQSLKKVSTRQVICAEPVSLLVQRELDDVKAETFVMASGTTRPESGQLQDVLKANLEVLRPFAGDQVVKISAPPGHGYEGQIFPLLDRYCMECHDEVNEEGEVNFENFFTERQAEKDPDFWETVADLLEMGQMPPARKEQPSEAERAAIIAWTEQLSAKWDQGKMGTDPGRTTIHRLNKNEYNYTIRDLFGLRLRPADNFPEESGGEAGFDNNADALFLPSLLMENYVEAAGAVVQAVYANPSTRNRYLYLQPGPGENPKQIARKVLEQWATMAYRRPVQKEELERLVSIYEVEARRKKPFDKAMRMPLVAILISPNFLYRSATEKEGPKPYMLSDFDLATRLSYFLWSSMPDRELFELAKAGELHKPEIMREQVTRMLLDDKASALSMHFAGQWLGWEKLRSTADPDDKKYPTFTFQLRVAMYRESAEFIQHLIKNNVSAYDIIDSDYAFLNEDLAAHYRIPGVNGRELRMVSLQDPNRGGVLGMGSVLTATSLPLRSSPAVRGNYVLAELLGTPPPEPPMDVAQLPDDDREIEAKTFREALEQHRKDPNCKGCHETIDPLGFSLENFDAIGRWRTTQNGLPLETGGQMPDGTQLASVKDLKDRLMQDKELFARQMVRKMLSYALGRELTPYDRPVIKEITDKVVADDARIHTAFQEVALSYPFRFRRNDSFKPTITAVVNQPNPSTP